jgi:energy-converting hydrogenase Eha subunit A
MMGNTTTSSVVLICLRVIPIILFLGSIFAYWYLVNVGPRELPRKHPLNRKMAFPVFVISIGMFMIPLPNLAGMIGIGISVLGIIWYAILFKEARDIFPAMTDAEWLAKVKARYGRITDIDTEDQDNDPEKDK